MGSDEAQQPRPPGHGLAPVHQTVHCFRCARVRAGSAGEFLDPQVVQSVLMSTVPNKVIYSMIGVSKYYDKKAVLKDIYLSYFYSAKIGVLGLNGSGKSSF